MSEAKIVRVRNVNDALQTLKDLRPEQDKENWRRVTVRGMETIEYKGNYITEYARPAERVLFSADRDANPFFHFFESLWILAGRRDVAFLQQFNSNISAYSDDGAHFHGAYGWRLRRHFRKDQLLAIIALLKNDPSSRRAVMSIWDPDEDLQDGKDIPCNDMVFFKCRDDALDMTVANRSNDAIWGAYGANAVQFSMLQEFVAGALGTRVGKYTQNSNSMHIYVDNVAWARVRDSHAPMVDHYADSASHDCVPYPLYHRCGDHREWLARLAGFFNHLDGVGDQEELGEGFFTDVALPMWTAWLIYKNGGADKNTRIVAAQSCLFKMCVAMDWKIAAMEWLQRRKA